MNKPAYRIRYDKVVATIWRNETENGVIYNVTLGRTYWDKKADALKDSPSLGQNDLLTAAKALNDAHTWIHQVRRSKQTTG